jgi:hypothetical protein
MHGVNEKRVQNFRPEEALKMIVGKAERNWKDDNGGDVNTLRTGSFKLIKRPFPGFLTILTL